MDHTNNSNPNIKLTLIRLNKFISTSGYCSRRRADELIESGQVYVNNKKTTKLGIKIISGDMVKIKDKIIIPIKNKFVILFHKPTDTITTKRDPQKRKTVISYLRKKILSEVIMLKKLEHKTKKDIYQLEQLLKIYNNITSYIPIGRLDRTTTGLLLLTNEKFLSHQLIHPSKAVEKTYSVKIYRPDISNQYYLNRIKNGLHLKDGFFKPDNISLVKPQNNLHQNKHDNYFSVELLITIHSGKNRILRRFFKTLGYPILALKRISFKGINLKDYNLNKEGDYTFKDLEKLGISNK